MKDDKPIAEPTCSVCAVTFDAESAKKLSAAEVRRQWPRFEGKCDACGFTGIRYASMEHYRYGDW